MSVLACRICGADVILSDDPAQRMSDVRAFSAAHRDHEEGLSIEASFREDDEATS